MTTTQHHWKFYRSGGVDQVALETRDDLAHLGDLDPKLWLALSMPTRGVEIDPRTLDLLDTDKDGHVRHPEVIAAVRWADGVYKDLGDLLTGGDTVALDRLNPGPVLAGARRLLANLDKRDARSVTLADASNAEAMFAGTLFNGDGVVPAEAAAGELRDVLEDIIASHGSLVDRSGKPGVDEARITAFFAEARAVVAWHGQADRAVLPLGEATAAAAAAVDAVRAKVEDYFTRCRLAAFDPGAAGMLGSGEAAFAALAPLQLSSTTAEIANLPLARIEPNAALPLDGAVNPAWRSRLAELTTAAIKPLIGARGALSATDWQLLLDKLAAHEAWRATRPTSSVEQLGIARLRAVVGNGYEAHIQELLAQDLAVKAEIDSIGDVERLCRYQRDLAIFLNNYVNFSQFYARKGGVFQAGTLFLDGRGCNLVFEVTDAAKHATMAPMAGAYIVYCDCVRPGGLKKTIAAAFTAGDVDNLIVGRNGVFVDRKGQDWEATITKVIDNPISIRQAFWSPYKKLVRMIEERVAKRAAAADAAANDKLAATASRVADKPAAPAPAAPEPKGMDIGTVAAIGVAIGGIGAFVTAGLAAMFGLGPWMPIGLVAILLLISGPSMLLAFIKLRRRNLGPLLDANGWAINVLTRINVPFGTALTDLARLPAGAKRSLKDPYAEKRRPWALYLLVLFLLGAAVGWFAGRLDKYLPAEVQSTTVLGAAAPAAEPPHTPRA